MAKAPVTHAPASSAPVPMNVVPIDPAAASALMRKGARDALAALRANFAGHVGTYSAASIVALIDEAMPK
jgi:hypothetical protein